MSLYGALAKENHLSEFTSVLETQGGSVLTASQRQALAVANLGLTATIAQINVLAGITPGAVLASKALVVDANRDIATLRNVTIDGNLVTGATTLSETDLAKIDGITNGTVAAGKAIVPDASKEITWAVTDAGVGTVTPINFALTATGAGASVDGAKFAAATEVALGTYANALNAKLDFGTAGKVTGLGGAFCSELDLGPGTTSGSYAVFEAELNAPASASTGTRTSFMSLNLWGAGASVVDDNGFLFDLNGLTANTGKLLREGLSQAVTATARLRCKVGSTTYYIPLCANEALTS